MFTSAADVRLYNVLGTFRTRSVLKHRTATQIAEHCILSVMSPFEGHPVRNGETCRTWLTTHRSRARASTELLNGMLHLFRVFVAQLNRRDIEQIHHLLSLLQQAFTSCPSPSSLDHRPLSTFQDRHASGMRANVIGMERESLTSDIPQAKPEKHATGNGGFTGDLAAIAGVGGQFMVFGAPGPSGEQANLDKDEEKIAEGVVRGEVESGGETSPSPDAQALKAQSKAAGEHKSLPVSSNMHPPTRIGVVDTPQNIKVPENTQLANPSAGGRAVGMSSLAPVATTTLDSGDAVSAIDARWVSCRPCTSFARTSGNTPPKFRPNERRADASHAGHCDVDSQSQKHRKPAEWPCLPSSILPPLPARSLLSVIDDNRHCGSESISTVHPPFAGPSIT